MDDKDNHEIEEMEKKEKYVILQLHGGGYIGAARLAGESQLAGACGDDRL